MRNKLSNSDRYQEVIENLKKAGKTQDIVYAYAFGMAWAYLSDNARSKVMKAAEQMAKENK